MIDFKSDMLFLAPMAEITTPSLRRLVRKYDSETVLYSEMLSAAAIAGGSAHNDFLTEMNRDDPPFIYQLLGGDPGVMAEACRVLSETGSSGIDINMGCSAPEIVKKFQGSRVMSDMGAAAEIVRSCRRAYSGTLSVKMRSGFENSDREYLTDFVKMLQGEGVNFVTLHPRHGRLSFRRTADWQLVKMLKKILKIPVVGNGDIMTPDDVKQRFEETGCDGIMIGRSAVTSPWIFRASRPFIDAGSHRFEVDLLADAVEVLEGLKADLPLHLHKSRGHRFLFYFTKNFVFSHDLFRKIRNTDSLDLMIEIIRDYVLRNPSERIKVIEKSPE